MYGYIYIYIYPARKTSDFRRRPIKYSLPWMMMLVSMKMRRRICKIRNSIVFERHLSQHFFCFELIQSEKLPSSALFSLRIEMDGFNFRIAEEKNFHSEVLLFAFNPEHDIIVVCSANGDVCLQFAFDKSYDFLLRSLLIKHTSGKFGH